MVMKKILSIQIIALWAATLPAFAAGPSVAILAPKNPHPLEQMAIEEVTAQLKDLFDAQVTVTQRAGRHTQLIVIGSHAASRIPKLKLGPQEHLVRSRKPAGRDELVVAGGSPQATYWAAIEFGHHFGVRRLLHADFPPLAKPKFTLAGINVHRKPVFEDRAWHAMGDSPAGPASWSLAEHRVRLRQLAKLKFTRIILPLRSSQPFLPQKKRGRLWQQPELRVDGETAGRAAFGRARVFHNPDFDQNDAPATGVRLVRGIVSEAKKLGLKVSLTGAASKTEVAAYRRTYPDADSVSQSGQLTTIEIGNLKGNVLPQFDLKRLHATLSALRQANGKGFAAACQLPDDLNTSVYYLAQASFDPNMTPARAVKELVNPICGEGVGARIAIGFDHLAKAGALVNRHDPTIATPRRDVIMRHYLSAEAVPPWWGEAKTGFIMAMNEMYRANTRARGGARAFSLYLAKRFEFALHYFTCIESLRAAGIARAAKDQAAQLEGLDKAVEAMHNAMSALADVDRNNGDRGVIALFNEYGFRPLVRELEKADR